MESIEELELITKYNFDTIDRVKLDDLDQRLAFNSQRVSTLANLSQKQFKIYIQNENRKAESIKALESAEDGHLERQAKQDEYFEKLKLAEDEARREDWEKLVEDSENFIVSF